VRKSEESNKIVPVIVQKEEKPKSILTNEQKVNLKKELEDHFEIDAKKFNHTMETARKLYKVNAGDDSTIANAVKNKINDHLREFNKKQNQKMITNERWDENEFLDKYNSQNFNIRF